MPTFPLAVLILGLAAAVVVALFLVMWRERTSSRDARVAIVSGSALAAWAALTTLLAYKGSFLQSDAGGAPPLGMALAAALVVMAVCLLASAPLRGLLSNQRNLTLLHLWRLVGAVFLVLAAQGQMPALWALPAGIGDILVGVFAPWVARSLDGPGGRRRGIVFNLLGMLDLIVAVGLGIATSPGALQVFHTTPTSALATRFPLALVPAFLVPLAFTIHVISLSQLLGTSWARTPEGRRSDARGSTAAAGESWRTAPHER
jgi:hypothetical protein